MKPYQLFSLLLFFSCTGSHTIRNNIDVNKLKTLPDNFYGYYRGTVMVSNEDIIIWYNINDAGNIMNIFKVQNNEDLKATTAQVIEEYSLDTVKEKASAIRFTQLSHKYHFGHINVDHKNKIAYSTNEDIVEEYVYPLNDSVTHHYQKDKRFTKLEGGWFKYKD